MWGKLFHSYVLESRQTAAFVISVLCSLGSGYLRVPDTRQNPPSLLCSLHLWLVMCYGYVSNAGGNISSERSREGHAGRVLWAITGYEHHWQTASEEFSPSPISYHLYPFPTDMKRVSFWCAQTGIRCVETWKVGVQLKPIEHEKKRNGKGWTREISTAEKKLKDD